MAIYLHLNIHIVLIQRGLPSVIIWTCMHWKPKLLWCQLCQKLLCCQLCQNCYDANFVKSCYGANFVKIVMMPTLSSVVAPQASWQPAVSPVMTMFALQEFVFLVSYKRYDMDHTLMLQMASHSLTLGWAMGYGVSVSIWRRLYYFTELMMAWIIKVIEAISNLWSDSPWWCNYDFM